mmetsp:Transcript_19819/g.45002  ORF Transcript_19819/g.45002 Transcript_19819/m.45002 type:complete len:90 (+) Transcript_19819:602-871(+)
MPAEKTSKRRRRRRNDGVGISFRGGRNEYQPVLTQSEFGDMVGEAFDEDDEFDGFGVDGPGMQMVDTARTHRVPVGLEGLDDDEIGLNG